MGARSIVAGFFFLALIFPLPAFGSDVQADSPPREGPGSAFDEWLKRAGEGVEGPIAQTRYYWDEGFHIVSRHGNLKLRIGGKFIVDGGYIGADGELQMAFPDLEGAALDLRDLTVSVLGTVRALSAAKRRTDTMEERPLSPVIDEVTSYAAYDAVKFKFEIDFANIREIKDIWIQFPRIPLLGPARFGNMKEPFSLERLTSIAALTFMETSLPTDAFNRGRNIGIRYDIPLFDERITLGTGGFLNMGSFSDVGDAQDQMSEHNGYDFTVRVTGLPWYAEEGARLFHLGLSYVYGIRDAADTDDRIQYRARPESRLTDDRLVDTGLFFADGVNFINSDFAVVFGPLSFQGQYYYTFTDADGKGDPDFWGFYVQGSYFLTGEHRNYNASRGFFSRVTPRHEFRPLRGGWGAWELGARFSYVDLNDEGIQGGRERNFTAGLNWYLTRNYRLMFNYVRAYVKDRATEPPVDSGRADIFQARFQIAY
jgi:phosphate-selective porin OprO/OprP